MWHLLDMTDLFREKRNDPYFEERLRLISIFVGAATPDYRPTLREPIHCLVIKILCEFVKNFIPHSIARAFP